MRAALLALCLAAALPARAEVPLVLGYQGHLTSATGQPVEGTVEMTFRLYAQSSGGAALWAETHAAVPVSNGAFSVRLGSVTPLALPFDQPYHLGIAVGADAEMAARLPLGAAGYAIRSRGAQSVAATVGTAALQDASITPDRLGDFCPAGRVLVRTVAGWDCGLHP